MKCCRDRATFLHTLLHRFKLKPCALILHPFARREPSFGILASHPEARSRQRWRTSAASPSGRRSGLLPRSAAKADCVFGDWILIACPRFAKFGKTAEFQGVSIASTPSLLGLDRGGGLARRRGGRRALWRHPGPPPLPLRAAASSTLPAARFAQASRARRLRRLQTQHLRTF